MRMRLRTATGVAGLVLVAAGCSTPTVLHAAVTTVPRTTAPSTTPTTVAAVPASSTTVPAGPEVVSATGVGPFPFGVTTEAQLVSALGPPDQRAQGSFQAPHRPDYLALGYRCGTVGTYQFESQVNGRYCETTYFVNVATGTLAAFTTNSTAFRTAKGTVVGTSAQEASHTEGLAVVRGCYTGIEINAADGTLTVVLDVAPGAGGQPTGPVADIRAEGPADAVGLLFC